METATAQPIVTTATANGGAPNGTATSTSSPPPASPPAWFSDFKNDTVKQFLTTKNFSGPEQIAESYLNLEKFHGVPPEKLIKLPEKLEGEEARAIFERLGAPKDAKEYELPKDEKSDQKFLEWAETAFHKNSLTKTQAQSIVKEYNDFMNSQIGSMNEARKNSILQADTTLKKEWGAKYDANINVAKQGAKILGLDAATLDLMEAKQGRDVLFKNLLRIGASVGESTFVDGNSATTAATKTPEQAQAEIKQLMADKKFVKQVARGDVEATARWNELNKLAAPGEKQIG